MNSQNDGTPPPTRRGFLAAAGGLAGAIVELGYGAAAKAEASATTTPIVAEPFWGEHQSGILTPAQSHTYFAAFDLTAASKAEVIDLLRRWTLAAAKLCDGQAADNLEKDAPTTSPDSGETLGLPPTRLTLTFGFGPGLFTKDGQDRYALASRRPEAFVDLPKFTGDQLVDALTGGDLSVQACADDPQVAFHSVRQLARLADGAARRRSAQSGFLPSTGPNQTPRNLLGFKDGTVNPSTTDAKVMDQVVWAGDEAPDWMRGGTYLVARRIRIALERWDRTSVAIQESIIGRKKISGAPLSGTNEFDPLDFNAAGNDGNLIIADHAHVRLAAAETNTGAQILRRGYSYNDAIDDAGLFFSAYQRDPRTGFIKLFKEMSQFDLLNQFVTHTGGGIFASPRGISRGEYIGQRLFASA